MAITFGKSPIIFTAQGDNLATIFQGRDLLDPTPVPMICINAIRFVAQVAGKCVLTEGPDVNARVLFESATLDPSEEDTLHFSATFWTENIYVRTLADGNAVYVYYE